MILLALLALPLAARDEPEPEPVEVVEVDHVALAALLIRDGHWARAKAELDKVDPRAEGVDATRWHTLMGLVLLKEEAFEAAIPHLQTAIDAGGADPRLLGHLATAQAGAGDLVGAWGTLEGADESFDRQRALILIELGLYQEALDYAGEDGDSAILTAEALSRGGARQQAIEMLEDARLRYPEHPELPLHLARHYLANDMPLAAGAILQVAAEEDELWYQEAAECFRRGGDLQRALMLNAQVPDPVGKSRQRLGLLLEAQSFERAVALEPRLERLGLLEDDEIAYGLAYAWFQIGSLERAEKRLASIEDPQVYKRAIALREAMARCEESGGCW